MAKQGSVWAMIEIGRCYQYGRGVLRDEDEAELWYERAFVGGSQVAMLKCADAAAARRDYKATVQILQVGVADGWIPAIFWLAWYRHKQSPTKQTYTEIFPMLKLAARRGHPAARMTLVNFMARGKFGMIRKPVGVMLAIIDVVKEGAMAST
jgi:TPR repeat protein